MKAYLKNYRQAPRKVRLVADMVRGKSVKDANSALTFSTKKAAKGVQKLIQSAAANAKQKGIANPDEMKIQTIKVDEGFTFMRFRARYGGRATPIRRHASHITVELAEVEGKPSKKAVKTGTKKVVAEKKEKSKKPALKRATQK